jgi:hypothetical protein
MPRCLFAAAQAWGFRTLDLRETAWFYSVGLLTAAILIWSPSQATPPPHASPTAVPAVHERSSVPIGELGGVASGPGQADGVLGTELLVVRGRESAPRTRIRRGGRRERGPVELASLLELRAGGRHPSGVGTLTLVDRRTRTRPRLARECANRVLERPTPPPAKPADPPRHR